MLQGFVILDSDGGFVTAIGGSITSSFGNDAMLRSMADAKVIEERYREIIRWHGGILSSMWNRYKDDYKVYPVIDGKVSKGLNYVEAEVEVDDMEGEREFMRAESEHRDLTEDERLIYSL